MLTRRWCFKRLLMVVIAFLVLYIIFSSRYHKYHSDVVISDTKPEVVWEYVADFSKMLLLNPSILDFKITSDNGHAHDWRYSVLYTERLAHWPYWLNTATADYTVTKSMPGSKPQTFGIKSRHKTCFFMDTYCLFSESEMRFSQRGPDTYCAESIQYQCPPFLTGACHRELGHQRKIVMHNLTTIFKKKQRSH